MRIIMMGPPVAGKGTQSRLIMQKYGLEHLSTGELLRKAMEEETPAGMEYKANYTSSTFHFLTGLTTKAS